MTIKKIVFLPNGNVWVLDDNKTVNKTLPTWLSLYIQWLKFYEFIPEGGCEIELINGHTYLLKRVGDEIEWFRKKETDDQALSDQEHDYDH